MSALRLLFILGFTVAVSLAIGCISPIQADDTTAPVSYLNLDGDIGNSSWYISTVDAAIRASDLESSPTSIIYQLNNDPPIESGFQTSPNAVINSSMESGNFVNINNWQKGPGDIALLWQSFLPAKYGFRSAAIGSASDQYHYWYNRNSAIPAVAGNTYTAQSWITTLGLSGSIGAWLEVWAMDSAGIRADVKLIESDKVTGDHDWFLLGANAILPTGYDRIYVKLGSQADFGVTWFDGVTMYNGTDSLVEFAVVDNGSHTLRYYSEDNAGNVEPQNTLSPLKIDTVDPQDWSDFGFTNTGNAHTWTTWVNVRDLTSGIAPSTAQFRWFDESGCNCWSSWINAASVTRVDNGAAAPSGYTGYVKVTSPSTNFGNSSINTTPKVQFRISDVAHSDLTESPVYALFGPWIQLLNGGDLYSNGNIAISGATPVGQQATTGVVMSGGGISNFDSSNNWLVTPYPGPFSGSQAISAHVPTYSQILAKAVALPANRMPSASGTYKYTGNYTMDSNSVTSAFQSTAIQAVIVIQGNLTINRNYSLNAASAVAFIVTGNIVWSGSVTASEGVMISGGSMNTSSSGSRLNHKGSFIGLGGMTLGRDLGRNGNPNNGSQPAEQIAYQPRYLTSPAFASLLSGTDSAFTWLESR